MLKQAIARVCTEGAHVKTLREKHGPVRLSHLPGHHHHLPARRRVDVYTDWPARFRVRLAQRRSVGRSTRLVMAAVSSAAASTDCWCCCWHSDDSSRREGRDGRNSYWTNLTGLPENGLFLPWFDLPVSLWLKIGIIKKWIDLQWHYYINWH